LTKAALPLTKANFGETTISALNDLGFASNNALITTSTDIGKLNIGFNPRWSLDVAFPAAE
jgi:hypothetical protein